MSTKQEVIKMLAALGATFPALSAQISKLTPDQFAARLDIAYDVLADIPSELLTVALRKSIVGCVTDFGPSIPDIRRAALAIIDHESGEDQVTPEAIWSFASRYCHTANGYGVASWPVGMDVPPLYRAVLDAFGYDRWAMRETENYGVDFAQFRSIVANRQAQSQYTRNMLPAENARLAGVLATTANRLRLPVPVKPAQPVPVQAVPLSDLKPISLATSSARAATSDEIIRRMKAKLAAPGLSDSHRAIYENVIEKETRKAAIDN